jgi:diadenosine tetraphosphatase ApaH/serine/threonine PP2A family protein phosphatase
VDRYLCLGDLVGYGADPVVAVDLLIGCDAVTVAGNHDHASAGIMDLEWFNPFARAAAEWTATRLRPEQVRYLAALPLVREEAGATLVHSSPLDPAEWTYLVTARDGARVFPAFDTPLCFVGHSHMPASWVCGPDKRVGFAPGPARLTIQPDRRYVVNVGSVGQPRDGDPRAAYLVLDLELGRVSWHRVEYDISAVQAAIRAAGLPSRLAARLALGI